MNHGRNQKLELMRHCIMVVLQACSMHEFWHDMIYSYSFQFQLSYDFVIWSNFQIIRMYDISPNT